MITITVAIVTDTSPRTKLKLILVLYLALTFMLYHITHLLTSWPDGGMRFLSGFKEQFQVSQHRHDFKYQLHKLSPKNLSVLQLLVSMLEQQQLCLVGKETISLVFMGKNE